VLPWPGSRIAIAVGAPYDVPRGADSAGLGPLQEELARRLHATYHAARAALEASKR